MALVVEEEAVAGSVGVVELTKVEGEAEVGVVPEEVAVAGVVAGA